MDLSKLNPSQKQAVIETEGPCMIIAGAGSGKTRVLTYKIAYLIHSGVSPFDILALTFTNKAAKEMKERIAGLISEDFERIWMGTFHSVFARILRLESEYIGFTRNYSIYDNEESVSLIKMLMSNMKIPLEQHPPKAIFNAISSLKNKLILPQEFKANFKSPFEKKVEQIYDEYQKALFRNNAMDFDDLLVKPIELFNKNQHILHKYQEKFKFILVDEYQDTNAAQYKIVRMLSEKYNNVSVVGDDAQSIYKWRGAEIENIFGFQNDFKEHKIYKLEQNYRSTKNILKFADYVIKQNKKQLEKNLWTENAQGEKIHLTESLTDKDEAGKICRNIYDEMQKKKLNFKDFVILYRTNAQSRVLEDSLRQNNMPYIIVGGIRFYQRKEIKDILAHLKVIVNPLDNESLMRVMNLKAGIGKTTLDKITAIAERKKIQAFDLLKATGELKEFSSKTKTKLLEVLNYIYKYQYLKEEMSVSELVCAVIDETGILRQLRLENTVEADERSGNIQELISAVAEYSNDSDDASLENFLQKVSLVADIDEMDNRKNAVTLMTIHSSKGLEFPVVFITGLEEGLFPISNAFLYQEEMEEERRLFYVAITRAMQKLYLSYANQRYRFGIQTYQMKSRFIRDIPDNLLKEHFIYESFKKLYDKKIKTEKTSSSGYSIKYEYYPEEKVKHKSQENRYDTDKFPDIQKGVTVIHDSFGKGTVLSISGKGLEKKAEIYFDDIGLKKIHLRYAKMTVENI